MLCAGKVAWPVQDGAHQASGTGGRFPEPELLPKHVFEAKLQEYIPPETWARLYPCAAVLLSPNSIDA